MRRPLRLHRARLGIDVTFDMDNLRKFGAAALGIVLLLYVFGSLRLVFGLLRGQAAGQPLWAIIGGLYIRFMIMAFFAFLIFALVRGQETRK